MKKIFYAITIVSVLLASTTSCKKAADQVAQNALYAILTSGSWTVKQFKYNKLDSTSIFKNWKTDFRNDNTFTSTYTASTPNQTASGAWSNTNVIQFNCNYSPAPAYPLSYLNATWTITGTSGDSLVTFTRTDVNNISITYSLQLVKR